MASNNHQIPLIGFGTFNEFQDDHKVGNAVYHAISVGYRHIDCAALYGNEKEIGTALKRAMDEGLVKREELFVASKLWNNAHRPNEVAAALDETLADLGLDYIDCYMIHWPCPWTPESALVSKALGGSFKYSKDECVQLKETWTALEALQQAGKTRLLGVSNFSIRQLKELLAFAKIKPAVNEVELHPYHQHPKLVQFCQEHDIHVTAYSPLGKIGYRNPGDPCLIDDPILQRIAKAHEKTPAQVALKWNIQRGVSVIPKSLTPSRIESNFQLNDFTLTPEEMQDISSLNRNHRFVRPEWWSFPDDEHELVPTLLVTSTTTTATAVIQSS
eukprot:m.61289 g.61289  ORF g.61289 m.61289 type:complete len:330 (+) comp13330_c0_seq1:258-1247(+)